MAEPGAVLYACPKPEGPPLYVPLGPHDVAALKVQAPLTLGYRFRGWIDPLVLCQSLSVLLRTFPAFAGCLVLLDDAFHVRTPVHDAEVQALRTSPECLRSPGRWYEIAAQWPLRRGSTAGGRFCQVLLLHTGDPSDGSTLLVTFDHALADAFTCGVVMTTWAGLHRDMAAAAATQGSGDGEPDPTSPAPPAPPPAPGLALRLPADFEIACDAEGLGVRRLFFHPAQFRCLREEVAASTGSPITVNTILMAICVSAVARFEECTSDDPFVSTMADARGRGLPPDLMGNGARAVRLALPWAVALSRDLAAVAAALHAASAAGLADLPARCQAAPADAPPAVVVQEVEPAGANPPVVPIDSGALLYFNSWARQRRLVGVDFGAPLERFEWVTLYSLQRRRSFIVVPVTVDGVLALQACLPRPELEYLCQLWEFFRAPLPCDAQ